MSIYEMYFSSDYFKDVVDKYVEKHRTTYLGAFKTMEIIDIYSRHLRQLNTPNFRKQLRKDYRREV